jgi:predicted glutamine amidotransferase
MCRFVLYLGSDITVSSLITEPSHSLIRQSFMSREREEPLNGDGFGVAWYVPELSREPAVFRDISPAWNNQNLLSLARVVKSPCIMAHVRAASSGLPVTQLNCHPFQWHELAFMHNGDLGGFGRIRRRLVERLSDEAFGWVKGSTDSEHIFAVFIDHYRRFESRSPLERLEGAMRATLVSLQELVQEAGVTDGATLNLAVTNGRCAVVSRVSTFGETPNSLYVNAGYAYTCVDGVCMMNRGPRAAVLIASEPLSEDEGWRAVPGNHMVLIGEDREPRFTACAA